MSYRQGPADADVKRDEAFVEDVKNEKYQDASTDQDVELSTEQRTAQERKLVRTLDLRLLPTIICIYIMNYIDRVAVSAARLKGFEKDLHLTDIQYATILAILYASYCPAQIPSNMIINAIPRPSIYIGGCVVLWGLFSALTGATHSFGGALATRILIGVPEAAFYPGAVFLMSRWYTKKELAFRGAIIYGGLMISNAFGSLIAAGILGNMNGTRDIAGWRWLFYIEGSITVFIGFQAMWLLPDYPHNTRWVAKSLRHLAQVRLAEDAAEADEDTEADTAWSGLVMAIKDPKVPVLSVMCCSQLLGLSFVNFFPTLTATLGYSTTISLLLCAPPWILATILSCTNAWHADRTGERFFHIAGWWWAVIVGYIIAVSTMSTAGRYVSMFLMASGYCGFALTLVWTSNIIPRPPTKRAAAIGIVNGFGNLGNLCGSYVWKATWGPDYHQSMYVGIAALVVATALAFVVRMMLIRENKHLDADERRALTEAERQRIEDAAKLEGISLEEAMRRKKGFRYLY